MIEKGIEIDPQNEGESHWKDIDKIVAGGWDAVREQIRTTTARLLEVAANICVHRKQAIDLETQREYGILGFGLECHIEDFVNLVRGFRPPKRSRYEFNKPQFESPFDTIRKSFPSRELLSTHMEGIDFAFFDILDAVEVLCERPGMPIPTFEELATFFFELSRLKSVQDVMQTAATSDLSSGTHVGEDFFGVGTTLAPIVSRIVPPRCLPGKAKITLPDESTIDHVIAAYLLDRYILLEHECYFERSSDESFDAASTHTSNHGTISAGAVPFHSPSAYCFDNRALDQTVTNTELVIEHAIQLGVPMDFTEGLVQLAKADQFGDLQYEADLIGAFLEAGESPTLTMRAVKLLLDSRFETSEAFKAWHKKRVYEFMGNDPEFQKNSPNFTSSD